MNIRQKFITLLLLIGIAPMLVASAVAYVSFNGSLIEKTIDQLSSTVIRQEQRISTYLQASREEATRLANQYDLQVLLRQYAAEPTPQNLERIQEILERKKIDDQTIQSISLSDLKGKVFASTATAPRIPSDIEVPSAGQDTTISVRFDEQDGFTKLFITTAVTINKQRSALLTAVFRTDELISIVQDYTGLDDTGETVVVAKDNASLFPLRFNTDAALKVKLDKLNLQSEDQESYESTDYRDRNVIVVSRSVGLTDWKVATKIDRDEALASINSLRTNMIAIVSIVVLAIILVALFFTRLFTRPILQIKQVAEAIGKGNFSVRTDVRQRDEIGSLAVSVNAMGQNLRELIGSIEAQRRRLQVILDSTTEAIFAIDENANIIVANHASKDLLFVDPSDLIGKNMHDLFSWTHGLQAFTVNYDIEDTHTYSNLQYVDAKNNQRYVKLIVTRVRDEGSAGRAHAIVTVHDETSSHELENMKTDFVSMAAHELRTPLTAVRGYLEMVQYKEQHNDMQDIDSYVRQALKNVADLGGLINNLLDVTRIERGTLTLNMEKVNLTADIQRAVDDLRFIANEKHISMELKNNVDGECYIVGDSVALREIVNNLLSNAIKYTNEGGHIEIRLTQKDNEYVVDVEDNGIGIPEKALEHLFSKFYRVHGGLDSGSTGTGLGLYIAKSIIDRHQGSIGVKSKEGVGSTFTFTLPVFTEERLKAMQPQDDGKMVNTRRKRGWITKNITR